MPYSMLFVPVVVVYLFICYEEFRRQFIVEAGIAYINVVYCIYIDGMFSYDKYMYVYYLVLTR
jgi:hypothetical protein